MVIDEERHDAALRQEGHVNGERLDVHDLHGPPYGGRRRSKRFL